MVTEMDILNRLRFHAEGMKDSAGLTAHLFTLAADEIERLRIALDDMHNRHPDASTLRARRGL